MTVINPELGVKETKEVLVGVLEVALLLTKALKDGVQISDVGVIIDALKNDKEFRAKLDAARKDISLVKAEMNDCSLVEGLELAMTGASYVPKIIGAMK